MKRSSRARLNRTTVSAFPGETLFDAVGRAVSRAECLPRKELFEAWEFARRVRRRFRGGPIFEVAGGHGLVSYLLLLLDATSEGAVCVDRRKPESAARLEASLVEAWPQLAGWVRYVEAKLDAPEVEVPDGALVVAVHACGLLTDRAIDLAVERRARVAVLPCCQDTNRSDTGGLEGWLEPRLAVDVMRVQRLRAAGYRIWTRKIPAEITPQNRLLLAEPAE